MTEVTAKRKMTAEDLYELKTLSGARISPDGKHIIYVVTRVDRDSEKKYSNLWLVPTCCGEPRQFTFGNQNDSSPEWSPDGTEIAFLSNRENPEMPSQLYVIPFHGGEARKVSDIKGMIFYYNWASGGKHFICSILKMDQETIDRMANEKAKKLGVVARVYDRVQFKFDGMGFLPKGNEHVYLVDSTSGEVTPITENEEFSEGTPSVSPDGELIAFISNRSERHEFNPSGDDIYVYSIKDQSLRKIEAPVGSKSQPTFSPDGKWLAYYGVVGEYTWHETNYLWVLPLDGSQPARNLTANTDYTCAAFTLNDTGSAEQMPPTWSKDGKAVYFQVDYHGSTKLISADVATGKLTDVIGEGGVVGSFHLSDDDSLAAYAYATIQTTPEVFVMNLSTGEKKQLTSLNSGLLAEINLGTIEEIWFKGPDQNDLQGWILFPPEFDPAKKYPSILEIHGGPTAQYGKAFMHEFYYLAAQGYVVYYTNPRGGTGYGDAHCKAIWGDWGNRDYADLMVWSDYMAEKPYIDTTRMGVTGGSYGGYMTVWMIGHTQRYKAAVTQRCVSNLTSMWGSSDGNWVFQQIFGNQPPFENVKIFWDHSPIAYIGNAKTPTMVIHSENDLRCPIEQGEQVYVALKYLGVPTQMVRFPEESHGLSRGGRTDRRIVRLKSIARWFESYL